jgi:hypothetical protein
VPTNEEWKVSRKSYSHMFYRERLGVMIGVFKEHLNIQCDQWLADIKMHGKARIDISQEFERLFAHTINHICFGEDFNDDKFDWLYCDPLTRAFTEKKVSMRQAIHNMAV